MVGTADLGERVNGTGPGSDCSTEIEIVGRQTCSLLGNPTWGDPR